MAGVLRRLDRVLPARAGWLAESWRDPVSEADLRDLRNELAPFAVPPELEAFLRWHDGQAETTWWPALLGHLPLDPSARMAQQYRECHELWLVADDGSPFLPTLLPLTWHGWGLTCLEVDPAIASRAVVNADLDNPDYRIDYPSLEALLDVVADLAEADLLGEPITEPWTPFYRAATPIVNACVRRHADRAWGYADIDWSEPSHGDGRQPPAPSFYKILSDGWPDHWKRHAVHRD